MYDNKLKTFATNIYQLWELLCKKISSKVTKHPNRHSLLPLKHSQMIIAGDRFREMYYWDSYWILKGLLISKMYTSALYLR